MILKLVPILYYQGLISIIVVLYKSVSVPNFKVFLVELKKFLKLSKIISALFWDENIIYDQRRQAILTSVL